VKPNRAGQISEAVLASVLRSIGLRFAQQVAVGRSIYDTELRVDFVIYNLAAYPDGLVVESKWQDVSGSVDEKFPYLVENIRRRYPMPVIVIAHGGGSREGAVRWLRACCDGVRLVAVFGLEEFISWALRIEKSADVGAEVI
jgi:hypothetical protein